MPRRSFTAARSSMSAAVVLLTLLFSTCRAWEMRLNSEIAPCMLGTNNKQYIYTGSDEENECQTIGLPHPYSDTSETAACTYILSSGSSQSCVPQSTSASSAEPSNDTASSLDPDFLTPDPSITFALAVGQGSSDCRLYSDTQCRRIFVRVANDVCQGFPPGVVRSFACAGGGTKASLTDWGLGLGRRRRRR